MMLRAGLPDVCADHGRPAVESRKGSPGFYASGDQFGARNALKFGYTMNNGYARPKLRDLPKIPELGIRKVLRGLPINSEAVFVRGEWPICTCCRRRALVFRWIGYFLVLCAMLTIVALVVARQRDMENLLLPLAFVVVPGWLPIGLFLTVAVFDRSSTHVHARITDDRRYIVTRAHPRFATAASRKKDSGL